MCSWINNLLDAKESDMNALGQLIRPSMMSLALIEAAIEGRPYTPIGIFFTANVGRTKQQALQRGRG